MEGSDGLGDAAVGKVQNLKIARGCRTAGPDLGRQSPSRLVATEAEGCGGSLTAQLARNEAPAQRRGFCLLDVWMWPNAEVPRRPLSRRCQGHSGHQRALIRGTPIYEYTP
jgi:hypothetical protein